MLLAQAASIQVVSIIHRIKVREIEVANFNTSVEYPSRPAGAAPVYVRVSGWTHCRSTSSHSPLSANFREFPLCEVREDFRLFTQTPR